MAGQVQGKVALVTGGASGIGAACARVLAREGAAVLLTDIDAAGGEAVAQSIRQGGGQAHFMAQDVAEEARWPEVVAEAERRFGGLQVLVCNAGIGIMVPSVLDMTLEAWRKQMAVNVDGVFLNVKHGIPAIRRAGKGGSVVMISSVAGLRGSAGLAGYSATKGAVRLFAKSVALECAGARDGIRVNSVHPGIIATPIWEKIPAGMGGGRNAPIDPNQLAAAGVPLGVASQAEDIAEGVLWLASDASRHVTGSELVIDGGMTAGRVGSLAAPPPAR
jgi:NAD(P)-dependent dehydrogenase (short-subunit alcohol dehydrogenase family)